MTADDDALLEGLDFSADAETVVADAAVGRAVALAVLHALGRGDRHIAERVGRMFTVGSALPEQWYYHQPPPLDPSSETVATIFTSDGEPITTVPIEKLV